MSPELRPYQQEIIDAYNSGKTIRVIAEKYNCWPDSIGNLLKECGISLHKKGQRKGCTTWNKGIKNSGIPKSVTLVEEGNYKNLSEGAIRKHVKRYLIVKNGHKCSICNTSEWNKQPIPLICDHIDGNSNNTDLNNFRIVCCNCDAQLPTYKSKNRGNGRTYDRAYYHNKRK